MRGATLIRTNTLQPWTIIAIATIAIVIAGAASLDTDRSELSEVSTKHYVSVSDQSANVDENSAQGTVVLNTVVSGTPTGCTIGNGNTDQDGDGARPFTIATDCVISVNDAGDLDYENHAQSYTLRIHVNDASSADIAFITITINDVNDVTPVYQAADGDDAITVAENVGTGSIDAGTITDVDTGNSFSCALSGADAGDFDCTITGTTVDISFKASPNYETPVDADTNNVYVVNVLINDGVADDANGATTLTITVTDVNDQTPVYEAADSDDAISVQENVGTGSIDAGTITDTDTGNAFTCTLGGADSGDFDCTVTGTTVDISFKASPNYEAPADADTNNVYVVTVLINDGVADDANDATTLTITVTDLNDQSPTWTTSGTASVDENTQLVATLAATDTDTADSGGLTYSIATNDNNLFTIVGGNSLRFSSAPDYEDPGCGAGQNSNTCTVVVRATDDALQTTDLSITVTITDLNLVIQSGQTTSISESLANGAAVMTVNQIGDSSGTTFYTINGGNDDGVFAINDDAEITIESNTNLDYDTTTSYTLVVFVSDGNLQYDFENVVINLIDVNDQAPVYQAADSDDAISVAENIGTGSIDAGTITDGDTANTFSCTLGGDDAGDFDCAITGTTVDISFKVSPNYEAPADADTNNVYVVSVLINDGVADDANGATTLTITVTDVNDVTPVYQAADGDDAISVAENSGTGSIDAGTITDADTGNSFTCTLGGDE